MTGDDFSRIDGPPVVPLKWDGRRETLPEGWAVRNDGNGRQESPVLTCLRNMGAAPAKEIADVLDRDGGNVSTQLRQMEERGVVRRTGRSVNTPGVRGGPQIEWEEMPEGGTPTGPGDALETGPGPVEQRLRALAEKVGAANARAEALEGERDEARREIASIRPRFEQTRTRVQELERQVAELESVSSLGAGASAAEEVLGKIRTLLEIGAGEDVFESIEALVEQVEATPDLHGQVAEARKMAGDFEKAAVEARDGRAEAQLRAGALADELERATRERDEWRARFEAQRDETTEALREARDHARTGMLERYFDELLELVRRGQADEHVMDRVERLIDPPAHD